MPAAFRSDRGSAGVDPRLGDDAPELRNAKVKQRRTALWRAGGTGRRRRLKIVRPQGHGGSIPSPATTRIDSRQLYPPNLHSLLHSFTSNKYNCRIDSRMQVYLGDSKSGEVHSSCGFDPHLGHQPSLCQARPQWVIYYPCLAILVYDMTQYASQNSRHSSSAGPLDGRPWREH